MGVWRPASGIELAPRPPAVWLLAHCQELAGRDEAAESGGVLEVSPPLSITAAEVDLAVELLGEAIDRAIVDEMSTSLSPGLGA